MGVFHIFSSLAEKARFRIGVILVWHTVGFSILKSQNDSIFPGKVVDFEQLVDWIHLLYILEVVYL